MTKTQALQFLRRAGVSGLTTAKLSDGARERVTQIASALADEARRPSPQQVVDLCEALAADGASVDVKAVRAYVVEQSFIRRRAMRRAKRPAWAPPIPADDDPA